MPQPRFRWILVCTAVACRAESPGKDLDTSPTENVTTPPDSNSGGDSGDSPTGDADSGLPDSDSPATDSGVGDSGTGDSGDTDSVVGDSGATVTDSGGESGGGDSGGDTAAAHTVFIDVSMGLSTGCAIREDDNHLVCWGADSLSEISSAPSGEVSVVDLGGAYCSLDMAGYATCWGYNYDGYLLPTTYTPTDVFLELMTGYEFACGRLTDQTVTCWGEGIPEFEGTYVDLAQAGFTSCGLTTEGTVNCDGGTTLDSHDDEAVIDDAFTAVEGDFVSITCAYRSCCLLDADGYASCSGEEVTGGFPPSDVPFTELIGGDDAYCGLFADQTVDCWGAGRFADPAETPTGTFLTIDGYGSVACGVLTDGSLDCWGYTSPMGSLPT